MYRDVMYGSDMEFFVQTRKGEFVPAIGMVGGDKDNPKALGRGYFIQEDNVAVEFNIPPAKSPRDFVRHLRMGFEKCQALLPAAIVPGPAASAVFAEEYIEGVPKALEFGCEPDLNAWTRKVNPRPRASNRYLRSCGGHIHISWANPTIDQKFELIKMCDVFASLPSIWEDKDTRRRQLYGKAGACRLKDYGVEHRVLSNYYLWDDHTASQTIFRYKNAIDFLNYGHRLDEADEENVQVAINTSNAELAEILHNKYSEILERARR